MNAKVTSYQFYKLWYEEVNMQKTLLQEKWKNSGEFTDLVFNCENALIKNISKRLQLNYFTNNYHVDAVFYEENDRVPNRPKNHFWFRNIQIAFEHENDFNSGLYQEVSHLLITNCNLRVLVTYYPAGDETPQLNYLHSIIQGTPYSDSISESESFLIIIGSGSDFEWDGYIYNNDSTQKWKMLQKPNAAN